LATQPKRRSSDGRTAQRPRRSAHDNDGIIPVLAKAVREVETAVKKGQLTAGQHSRFQAVALLARAERARVRADASITEAKRDTTLKRLDGVATILAQTAAREPSLFSLLQEDAEISDATRRLQRQMQIAAGLEPAAQDIDVADPAAPPAARTERRVVPQSVVGQPLPGP